MLFVAVFVRCCSKLVCCGVAEMEDGGGVAGSKKQTGGRGR